MTNVVLIGAGGHSKVIQDIIKANRHLTLHAVLDQKFKQRYTDNGVIYWHTDFIDEFVQKNLSFSIAIGNNKARQKLVEQLPIPADKYISLIHPDSTISPTATIGCGTVVMAQTVINADTSIGKHAIINSGSVVEHDNKIGNYAHISPSASLSGTVTIGEGTHIGTGAIVIPGKTIGKWSTVGAGAVAIKNIEDGVTAVGVPAMKI